VRTDEDTLIIHYLDHRNPLVAIEALTPRDAPSARACGAANRPASVRFENPGVPFVPPT
jgi:hypothetical protein